MKTRKEDEELFDYTSKALDFMVLLGFDLLCAIRYTKNQDAIFDVGTDQYRSSIEGAQNTGEVMWAIASWAVYYDVMDAVKALDDKNRQMSLIERTRQEAPA